MLRRPVKAFIMAGGKGERFWPASTPSRPKQFIDIMGGGTLIQQTVSRIAQIIPFRDIYVLTSQEHMDLAQAQLPQIPERNFIMEPVGRDTAPCIGLAAVWTEKVDPETLMLVVPADHFIPEVDRFCDLIQVGLEKAAQDPVIVTIGIRPTRPETGYGYIEIGEESDEIAGAPVFKALQFVEKPNQASAEEYLATGRFLWNSGMFAWSVQTIRSEIAKHLPELHVGLEELAAAPTLQEMAARLPDVFPGLPKVSIDKGVMERSDRVYVVPSDFAWDDLGSWSALTRLHKPDEHGNILKGMVITEDCENLLVESKGRIIATLGVSDIIIVETEGAVLVCARERAQDIRRLAERVRQIEETTGQKGGQAGERM